MVQQLDSDTTPRRGARRRADGGNGRYALDNAWERARERLTALEAWLDPGTIGHLAARGVAEGWHCLEVGAGGGSIADWLCRRVGSAGRVVATDLDPRFLAALDRPNLDVRRHDIVADDLPEGAFDLVHARLVLAHLPEWERALARMVGALKPGSWLMAEEMDFVSLAPDLRCDATDAARFGRVMAAHHAVLAARGFDPFYGRGLLGRLRAHGLVELGAEGRSAIWRGGSPGAAAWRLTLDQLRGPLLASGAVTDEDLGATLALLDDPGFAFLSQVTVAAWGRRPAA